jgi:hypothetical protein
MSRATRNLQLLWRSEHVLAEAKLKLLSRKLALQVVAGIACLLGLGMFNVAGYFALATPLGTASAALIIGLVDVLIAGLLGMIAHGLQLSAEENMVREIRDSAISEIGAEVDDFQQRLLQLGSDIETVRTTVAGLVQRPLDTLLPGLIVPALTAVTKLAKAGKKAAKTN